VVALDVEWTKNYHIKDGSRPFCFSFVRVEAPPGGEVVPESVVYCASYCERDDEEPALLMDIDNRLGEWLASDVVLTGHQLSTDLAVVDRAAKVTPLSNVRACRAEWHNRHSSGRVLDTRYDLDPSLLGDSRRLVDVCSDVGLDVYQPELLGASMSALHRNFIETKDASVRESLATLNLRHSLSTAILALYHLGASGIEDSNLNNHIHDMLAGVFAYVGSSKFHKLLG
jgi:hypothetical protein